MPLGSTDLTKCTGLKGFSEPWFDILQHWEVQLMWEMKMSEGCAEQQHNYQLGICCPTGTETWIC